MIKPKAINHGDTIGIVATSGPIKQDMLNSSKVFLESLGFNVILSPSCTAMHGYLAGVDQLRANDLNNLFANPDIKGIICLRGGYGASRILDKIDFEIIKANPKVFVGYSDITALHIAIIQRCQLITFHGPMLADMASGLDKFSTGELLRAIMEPRPMGPINNPVGINIQTLVGGKAQGEIIGGNLALITSTLGTPYEIDTKEKLLLLEEIGEEPYRIDRMLTQLRLAGKFDNVAGIILGDWYKCEPKKGKASSTLMDVVKDILVPLGVPILYNLKAGHCTPKVTIPLGVKGIIYGDLSQLVIEKSAII